MGMSGWEFERMLGQHLPPPDLLGVSGESGIWGLFRHSVPLFPSNKESEEPFARGSFSSSTAAA